MNARMSKIFHHLKWLYRKLHLRGVMPFLTLVSYTLFGAAIFRHLELERDQNERATFRISYDYAMKQMSLRMVEITCQDVVIRNDKRLRAHHADEALRWFIGYLNLTSVIKERNDTSPWSWYGSMFYAGQLYTTIGYGLPVAKTRAGQIVSIFYIMFGIPIFLTILKDVGRVLSRALRKLYKRLRTARSKLPQGNFKHLSTPVKALYESAYSFATHGMPDDTKIEIDKELGPDEQNELNRKLSNENSFPIPIALGMLILWIALSAWLFCLWEHEWGYLTSVYFFFVSISTVGLGDIVPENKDMMLLNFILILIGLALLSMCVNLIQVAIERLIDQLLQQYIKEMKRVAAIVHARDRDDAQDGQLEIGVTAELMKVPFMAKKRSMWSFPRHVKDWLAGKIANNLISSRLDDDESDQESEEEASHLSPVLSRIGSLSKHRKSSPQNQTPPPAVKAIQAIEKARLAAANGGFQSMLFSKFATNSRTGRLIEQYRDSAPDTCSKATQTERHMNHLLATPDQDITTFLEVSNASTIDGKFLNTSSSTFELPDFDSTSMISRAYYDVGFDEPYGNADRISQLVQRSLNSLSALPELHATTSVLKAPIAQNENTSLRLESRRSIYLDAPTTHRSSSVPSNSYQRSHRITNNARSQLYCQFPYRSLSSFGRKSRVRLDCDKLNRLRYLVGIIPEDFTSRGRHSSSITSRRSSERASSSQTCRSTSHPCTSIIFEDDDGGGMYNLLGTLQYEDTSYCT